MSKSKNKHAFKSLVKECLIEILAEGLVGNSQATLSEVREFKGAMYESEERRNRFQEQRSINAPTSTMTSTPKPRSNSYLDRITSAVDNAGMNKSSINESESIKKKVSSLTDDPIMADIFADTAMTTLREQKEGVGSTPSVARQGDQAAKVVDSSLPEDLFGGASAKWADLAFAAPARKS